MIDKIFKLYLDPAQKFKKKMLPFKPSAMVMVYFPCLLVVFSLPSFQFQLEPAQTITVNACTGLSGVNESCTVVLNGTGCSRNMCSHLVVIFSGGDMGCVTGAGLKSVTQNYTKYGWASACINYFETSTGSGMVPYWKEKDRLDTVLAVVTNGSWASRYWTKEYLLLQGISHGASSPLIVMARFDVDSQYYWKGKIGTAGCFFDGSVNQSASADLLATGGINGKPCIFPVPYTRWLQRYCGSRIPSNCQLMSNDDALLDLIENVPASNFSIKLWRLYECGSRLPPCTGDIIPMKPFEILCSNINSSSNYSCDFHSLPYDSHLTCHANYGYECREWFESFFPVNRSLPSSRPSPSISALPTKSSSTTNNGNKKNMLPGMKGSAFGIVSIIIMILWNELNWRN